MEPDDAWKDRKELLIYKDALKDIEEACRQIATQLPINAHEEGFNAGWATAHMKIAAYCRAVLRKGESIG